MKYICEGFNCMDLTILMPCLNEEKTIAICIEKALDFLSRNNIDGEVLIVDNGSSDNSKLIASNAGARVVSTSLRGYGNALRFGIKEARGKYIIYGDCDNGYDFSSLDDYYCMLKEMYVLVNGNFYLGVMEKDSMFFSHRYIEIPFLLCLFFIFDSWFFSL